MPPNNIMLDLETLDTAPTAVILSIGAVAFDPITGELGERFYVELTDHIDGQQQLGRTISGKTVRWWLAQNALAKRVFSQHPEDPSVRVSPQTAASEFSQFVGNNGEQTARIWGNGAAFDNVILRSLYEMLNIAVPWSYSQDRCYRTLRSMPGVSNPGTKAIYGVEHNALDDAIGQALHMKEIYKCLGIQ